MTDRPAMMRPDSREYRDIERSRRQRADTPPNIRERGIETLYDMMTEGGNIVTRDEVARYYDAILTELQEPSEGMVEKGYVVVQASVDPFLEPDDVADGWQAMIQHIRDGGS